MLITARSATSPAILGRFLIATFVLSSVMATSCSREAANQQAAGADSAGGANARGGRGGGRGGGGAPVPVVTGHSVSKPMPVTIPAVGTAEPLVTVQVRAQVTGQLSRVHFREGQDVNKGDTLFTLWIPGRSRRRSGRRRPFWRATRRSRRTLSRSRRATRSCSTAASFRATSTRRSRPRASALEATLAADQSQVENARLNLQYATIKAPISGRTGALAVHEGDLVRANDTAPLVVINQVAPIYVTFSVPGRYLPRHPPKPGAAAAADRGRQQAGEAPGAPPGARRLAGTAAPVQARRRGRPALSRSSLREGGVVSFIDNTVDPTTGTIKLKGTFANADHALWPGLFVQVTLVLTHRSEGASSCRLRPCRRRRPASTCSSSSRIAPSEMRNVTVERQQGEEMVIAQGLTAGEEVVTDGQLRLTPGARVTTGTRGQGERRTRRRWRGERRRRARRRQRPRASRQRKEISHEHR